MTKDLRFYLKIIKVEKDKAEHGFIARFFSWKKLCDIGNMEPRRKVDPHSFNVVTIVKLVTYTLKFFRNQFTNIDSHIWESFDYKNTVDNFNKMEQIKIKSVYTGEHHN